MLRFLFTLFTLCLSAPIVSANESDLNDLYLLLENKTKDKQLHQKAINSGVKRAFVCKYCHGQDGNSKRDHIPNLAQQNSKYLLRQFELFASLSRKNKIMSELAKTLTADDRVNIALYYAQQKVKLRKAFKPELAELGKYLFNTTCASCHGDTGHGYDELPRIAGQPAKYVVMSLKKYKSGSTSRPDSPMQAIAQRLSGKDINALAAYLSVLE